MKVSDGVFRPAKGTETVADDKTVVTDNNGKLQFTGLKEGTYKVKEIKAPTGYNLLKDPITVTISATYDENTGILESWKVNNANAQGTTVPVITVENNKGAPSPRPAAWAPCCSPCSAWPSWPSARPGTSSPTASPVTRPETATDPPAP